MNIKNGNVGSHRLPLEAFDGIPLDAFERLCRVLRDRIAKTPFDVDSMSKEDRITELFFIFLASLQLFSLIAGRKTSKRVLMRLTLRTLRNITDGILHLSVRAGEVFKHLHPVSVVLGQALVVHLGRGRGKGRRRVGLIPGKIWFTPLFKLVNGLPAKRLWSSYLLWLQALGEAAGFEKALTYKRFLVIIQREAYNQLGIDEKSLLEIHNDVWPYNPAPNEQSEAFWDLTQSLDFAHIAAIASRGDLAAYLKEPKALRIYRRLEPPEKTLLLGPATSPRPPYLADVQNVIAAYHRDDREKKRSVARADAQAALKQISQKARQRFDNLGVKSDRIVGRTQFEITLRWMIASWLVAALDMKISPKSLSGRLTTMNRLLSDFPGQMPQFLEEDDFKSFCENHAYIASSANRHLRNLDDFRAFVNEVLGQIIHPNFHASKLYRYASTIRTVKILTRFELQNVLGCLKLNELHGELAYYAVLLQICFGLRSKSALEIKIDGILDLLGDTPTIVIPPIKRRMAAEPQYNAAHLDQGVLRALDAFLQKRLAQAQGDTRQLFIASADGQGLSSNQYMESVNKAMWLSDQWAFEEVKGQVTHWFRHYAANRWLALGLTVEQIRDYLNHRQSSTTLESYIHSTNFVTSEKLSIDQIPDFQIRSKGVAFLLGITTRQLRELKKRGDLMLMEFEGRRPFNWGEVQTLVDYYYRQGVGVEGDKK